MHATLISAAWLKQWLYDWGGANLNLFMFLNQAVPDQLLWLPEVLSWVGSYWGAPAIAAVLWSGVKAKRQMQPVPRTWPCEGLFSAW